MHCHIVPCVDDGAASLEEAVKMVEAEYKQGVRRIIVTPHFRKGMFEPSALEVKKTISAVKKNSVGDQQRYKTLSGLRIVCQ